jgi:hypothetical protein
MNIVIPDGQEEETAENFALGKLPALEERIFSENLGMLCQGEWQPRYLVLDATFASISLVGSDDILDKIPLVQFQFVPDLFLCANPPLLSQHEIEKVANTAIVDAELSDSAKYAAFNIHTLATGYNGGRTYCFRADQVDTKAVSSDRCNEWIEHIKRTAKLAHKRVAQRTFMQASKVGGISFP